MKTLLFIILFFTPFLLLAQSSDKMAIGKEDTAPKVQIDETKAKPVQTTNFVPAISESTGVQVSSSSTNRYGITESSIIEVHANHPLDKLPANHVATPIEDKANGAENQVIQQKPSSARKNR